MNERKIIKFNLYMTCVVLVLMIVFLVGTTLAYFSDSEKTEATLTSGNVSIRLDEAAFKRDGSNLVEDPTKPRIFGSDGETVINDYGKIYPGQSIYKDPTVTNTGDTEEWIAIKVTLTDGSGDLTHILGYENSQFIDIKGLLSGGILSETARVGVWNGIPYVRHNDHYAMVQKADVANSTFEFFFFILEPLQPQDSVVVFDHIIVPMEWDNEDMQELANLKIQIQAFGVQTTSLDSCLKAMTAAFPDHFVLS